MVKSSVLAISIACLASIASCAPNNNEQHLFQLNTEYNQYAGQKVLRCQLPENESSAKSFFDYLTSHNYDVWNTRVIENEKVHVDVRVEDEQQEIMLLKDNDIDCSVWINDLSDLLSIVHEEDAFYRKKDDFFKSYHAYNELYDHVKQLAQKHSDIAVFVPSIGKTWEQRDIAVIHITNPKSDNKNKKVIWINGGIHAREWISSHTAVYIIHHLLSGYGKDAVVTELIDNIEFVISPHINPDGYEFSRTQRRFWRKNRRDNGDGSFGVDLNRNYDVYWDGSGSSTYPGSDIYRGPSPGSEPETQACMKYINSLKKAVLGIDLHSYGQLLLRPYGFGYETHPLESLNKQLGDGMRDTIYEKSKKSYTSQRSVELYPASGGMDDWMSVNGLVGFTIELRDRGLYGFALPANQIIPTGEEVFEAIKFAGKYVIEKMPHRKD